MRFYKLRFRGKSKLWLGGLLLGIATAAVINSSNPFEMDGNATQNTSDDWQNVNATGGSSVAHTGVAFDPSSFSGGNTVTDPSTFVQGSKDVDEINNWHTAAGGIPPKDDIVNAYAAAYNVNGDLVITFGADRFANNGSAQLGFWFFQNNIAPNVAGTGFTGSHAIGDLLVLVNFDQGGGVPTIQVLKWVGGRNPLTPLSLPANTSVLCSDANVGPVCAITNSSPPVSIGLLRSSSRPLPEPARTPA